MCLIGIRRKAVVNRRLTKRQQEIVDVLKKCNGMSVDEIAERFGVTPTTIRRELLFLENNMLIVRSRGYARIAGDSVSPFETRNQLLHDEKLLIAQRALEYVNPDDTIIMDSGTTTYALASKISSSSIGKLGIVTNSLPVASILASKCLVMVTGGMVEESTLALVGPNADSCIESMVADKVFLGATGINIQAGLTTVSPLHLSVKTKMIKSADQNFVLIDSSKFNTGGLNVFCKLQEIGTIITVRTAENAEKIEYLKSIGVRVDYIDMVSVQKSL